MEVVMDRTMIFQSVVQSIACSWMDMKIDFQNKDIIDSVIVSQMQPGIPQIVMNRILVSVDKVEYHLFCLPDLIPFIVLSKTHD